MIIQKTAPKNVSDANIGKYYLLTLTYTYQDKREETVHFSKNEERKMSCSQCLFALLIGYDRKFRFESVVVLKETMNRLPESANKRFTKQNLQMKK